MMTPPKAGKPPKIQRVSVQEWEQGTVTAFDDGRTPEKGLLSSTNMILEQNGTVRPRPSMVAYGPQPLGRILGEVFEFRKVTTASVTNWLICLQNVNGTTRPYVAKGEDATWTECTGKTYDNGATAHFLQVADKILVMNGVDTLSYVDIDDFTVTSYTKLNTPAAPTLDANTGLTGTAFKVYYAVTANSTVGETDGSPVLTQSVSIDRDLWNPDTQNVKIKWTTVPNVKSWNVYMGVSADGAGAPKLYLIASKIDPGTLSFTDNGTRAQDLTRPLPTGNGTAGPSAKRGTVSNGRPWLVGDKDHPYYVWRGGDYGYELDFSPANGGGFTPVGNGTKEVPNAVISFRDGKGDAKLMVLSQGTNGTGKRFYLDPTDITYGTSTFVVWKVTEDSGQDGTDSPDGLIIYQNSAFYPSRDGFKSTGTKPQLQNVLSTDRISNTIQKDISTISTASIDKAVGLAYEGRLYWSLPISSTKNNQIWVLDLDRKGAWMKPWSIAADWMTLYNDNAGKTHFLVVENNNIFEFTYAAKTMDGDSAFITGGTSGQVKFSEDGREWGRVLKLVFMLMRPQGSINFTVSGKTEDGVLPFTVSKTFANTATRAGWSEPQTGWSSLRGWSEIKTVPESFNSSSEEVEVEVDEDMQWYQYSWSSTEPSVDYSLSDVVCEYVPIGVKDLS